MNFGLAVVLMGVIYNMTGCTSHTVKTSAPVAKKIPKNLEKFGDTRVDNYFWMRNRDTEDVLSHLHAENEYTKKSLSHTADLQRTLFSEMKERVKKDDSSVPYEKNGYYFYQRFEEGKEYPIFCNKKGSLDSPEEILLDVNQLAEGKKYYSVAAVKMTPDRKILAFAVDTVGRRKYDIYFKNMATGELTEKAITETTSNFEWGLDSANLYFARQHAETLRWDSVHRFDTAEGKSHLVFHEEDDKFFVFLRRSRTNKYLLIGAESSTTSEWLTLRLDQPQSKPKPFTQRQQGVEYSIEHGGDRFYILTNKDAQNFRLMESSSESPAFSEWQEVIPHRADTLITSVQAFSEKLAILQRKNGLRQLVLMDRSTGKMDEVQTPDPSYYISFSTNPNYQTDFIRYNYESLTRPDSVFDYFWGRKESVLKKEQEVLGGFDRQNYVSERLFATAADGEKIPLSVVYKKGTKKDGSAPALIYGYGSYGYSMEPFFNSTRLSLLDRGFVFVMAHVRGGSEMGRHWYENGKMENKKNTFSDFIAASEFLVSSKLTSPDRLFAMGGSAGGLLMGVIINQRPELYKGIISAVPFVDALTTMLDDSLPLTTNEYEEWGNPNEKKYYEYIKSYSPYDNIVKKDYPHVLVTTGYHDSQVQYWEPAKWVAKLREHSTSGRPIYFKVNMDAGHSGTTGRFERLKETSLHFAFLIDLAQQNR